MQEKKINKIINDKNRPLFEQTQFSSKSDRTIHPASSTLRHLNYFFTLGQSEQL